MPIHRQSRTRLIATLGPASSGERVLRSMFEEGLDACRINFSHGTREEHRSMVAMVRDLNRELGTSVALLGDLQGPKIRVGELDGGFLDLVEGQELLLAAGGVPSKGRVTVDYPALSEEVVPGDRILLDDGRIQLEVTGTLPAEGVETRVEQGGRLLSRKGVNLPSTRLSLPSMTPKDEEDALFAMDLGLDWIALSFVRSASDMETLRNMVLERGSSARLIAKIEKPEAVNNIDSIIAVSDAVMVARGDLGVEMDFDRVPMLQKMIVRKCIAAATPVIIATQMMESMINSYRPTRAEAADVANAVLEGADSLMLSGETAVGRHPGLVVRNIQRIIDRTEEEGVMIAVRGGSAEQGGSLPDSICFSAVEMAGETGARAIVTFTHSGHTAVRISSHRPEADIYAFTMNRELLPMLSLVWGVRGFYMESTGHIEDYVNRSTRFLAEAGLASSGDIIVHVGSMPLQEHGKTNMIRLTRL
ncbi:MAG: hypothetical protein AVO35_02155 [Candidatus Aegiribacteria sp. MLS_C]|nr:MAG: hypothetical protein AVO35_02155 [Candidatus Aegiribacteria sp. MLS_C]